jgi:hypothetical protein
MKIKQVPQRSDARLKFKWSKQSDDTVGQLRSGIELYCHWLQKRLNIINIETILNNEIPISFLNRKGKNYSLCGVASVKALATAMNIYTGNTKTARMLFEYIAHEMTHLKQYHYGELIHEGKKSIWKGEKQTPLFLLDTDWSSKYKRYRQQPHELEAFGNQESLANEWNEERVRRGLQPIDYDQELFEI